MLRSTMRLTRLSISVRTHVCVPRPPHFHRSFSVSTVPDYVLCNSSSGSNGVSDDKDQNQDSSGVSINLRKIKAPASTAGAGSSLASELGSDLVIGGKVVLGAEGGATETTWRELDAKVNKYPGQREFKAIGSGGTAFSAAMLAVIENVVGPVQAASMTERPSSKGSYMSVTIGPVWVMRPEQVVEIYAAMKADPRLKWYM